MKMKDFPLRSKCGEKVIQTKLSYFPCISRGGGGKKKKAMGTKRRKVLRMIYQLLRNKVTNRTRQKWCLVVWGADNSDQGRLPEKCSEIYHSSWKWTNLNWKQSTDTFHHPLYMTSSQKIDNRIYSLTIFTMQLSARICNQCQLYPEFYKFYNV